MNNTKNILLIAAITSLLIMGTTVVPMQSYAGESKNTKDSKSSIKANVGSDKKSASQDLDQDNFCYRGDEDCQQANEGQQMVGKDNEGKGFNDQSKNIQQQAVSPTSASTQPLTPGPTPTILNVCKEVVNEGSTSFQPLDFIFDFDTPANPDLFRGANVGCTPVTVAPGTFNFTETIPPGITAFAVNTAESDCQIPVGSSDPLGVIRIVGTIAPGETQTCIINNIIEN